MINKLLCANSHFCADHTGRVPTPHGLINLRPPYENDNNDVTFKNDAVTMASESVFDFGEFGPIAYISIIMGPNIGKCSWLQVTNIPDFVILQQQCTTEQHSCVTCYCFVKVN